MKIVLFIVIIFLLGGCNPCKRVAAYPECFPADTVKLVNNVIKYEKIYITEDSIIFDTIPCLDEKAIVKDIIYKTIHKTKIDTIYTSKEISIVNPINEMMREQNISLLKENENLTKYKRNFFISLLLIILFFVFVVYKGLFSLPSGLIPRRGF